MRSFSVCSDDAWRTINPVKLKLTGRELKEVILHASSEQTEKLRIKGLGFRGLGPVCFFQLPGEQIAQEFRHKVVNIFRIADNRKQRSECKHINRGERVERIIFNVRSVDGAARSARLEAEKSKPVLNRSLRFGANRNMSLALSYINGKGGIAMVNLTPIMIEDIFYHDRS